MPEAAPHSCLCVQLAFPAMGSTVTLMVRAGEGQVGAARRALAAERAWFGKVERLLSRFDPASELSRINRAAGRWWVVSPLTFSALEAARRAYERTGGLFDPSILGALKRWGYDRDLRLLGRAGPAGAPPAGLAGPPGAGLSRAGRAAPFALDPVVRAVRVEDGFELDLGGIVKGLAADTAAERLARRFGAALVDAGGDIAARSGPGHPPWRIGLGVTGAGLPAAVRVRRGAVATSATARRWHGPLGPAHHLIDPRTQAPAASGLRAVTVVARLASQAEVLAKAILIAGPEAAPDLARRAGGPVAAFWRADDGRVGSFRCRCG